MNTDNRLPVAAARKITINIPVDDAASASELVRDLFGGRVIVNDGPKYVLVDCNGVRLAFVSGQEDITGGRPALAVEVPDPAAIEAALQHRGVTSQKSDHPADRFLVGRLDGAMDLIYYTK